MEYLGRGYSKADSLRRTKIDMIRQRAAPGQWAGFLLFGESHGIVDFDRHPSIVQLPALATVFGTILILAAVIVFVASVGYRL